VRKIFLAGAICLTAVVAVALYMAIKTGTPSPAFASGDVYIDEPLVEDAKGIRTMFITVFDADSPAPMPYGAMKETIDQDPEGKFTSYYLSRERLQLMNPEAPLPQRLRIKARLDRDGMGGMDQPGDLVGVVNNVAFGSQGVNIRIDTKIR
jgi:hypothetical protein